jgi:hypothetical protein
MSSISCWLRWPLGVCHSRHQRAEIVSGRKPIKGSYNLTFKSLRGSSEGKGNGFAIKHTKELYFATRNKNYYLTVGHIRMDNPGPQVLQMDNGKSKKLRNRNCWFWLHWKNISWQRRIFFFYLFTLCSARVSALVIELSANPCERTGKLETCPILKKDRLMVRV